MSAGVFPIWLAKINVKKKSAVPAFSIFGRARRQVQAFLNLEWKGLHMYTSIKEMGVLTVNKTKKMAA
jgi:hypothetical protein